MRWERSETGYWARQKGGKPRTPQAWGTGHAREYWAVQSHGTLDEDEMVTDLEILKRRLRVAVRLDQAATIQEAVTRRDRLAEVGKLRTVILTLLKKNTAAPSLRSMVTATGVTTDPQEIHNKLTADWEQLFRIPAQSLPSKAGLEPAHIMGGDVVPMANR